MTRSQFIKWLEAQIEWCDQLFLCKEDQNGLTYRDIKITKDTLESVEVRFYDIEFTPSSWKENARIYAESQMPEEWDRKDGLNISIFYNKMLEYIENDIINKA